jgi:hypothetical protein
MNPPDSVEVTKIAVQFSKRLLAYCGRENLNKAWVLNATDPDKEVCHSHDFCDANVFMMRAYRAVTGKKPNTTSDDVIAIWNAAWDIAKQNRFYLP